jgi:hypothetical protein
MATESANNSSTLSAANSLHTAQSTLISTINSKLASNGL